MYVALFIQGQGAFPGKQKMQEKVITEKAYTIVFTFIFHNEVLTYNICLPLRTKR